MHYLLCLLFVSASVFAQPVEGPYLIAEPGGDILLRSIGVGTRGEAADIFYFADSILYAAEFSLSEHTLTVNPYVLRAFPDVHRLEIHDPIALDSDRWGSIVYEDGIDYLDTPVSINRTYFLFGDHETYAETVIDTGFRHDSSPISGENWNETFSLARREGGGAVAGWIEAEFYLFDVGFYPYCCLLSDAGQISELIPLDYNATGNPDLNRVVFRSITASIVIGSFSGATGEGAYLWGNDWDSIGGVYWAQDCESMSTLNFGRTADGDLFTLYLDSAYPAGLHASELAFVEGWLSCFENHLINIEGGTVAATSWHPDYGFAILTKRNHDLLLARVDTSLNEVQPLGHFLAWQNSSPQQIADMSISDDGNIVVLYTDGNPTQLNLATIGWNTYLDADNPRFTPLPSQLALSVYPNPFNSTVSLKYELAEAGEVQLKIYNLAGQEVAQLAQERQGAGQYSIDWSPQGASGIYFAKLTAGHKDCISKLVYLR